jgi:hypothetical protein
MFEHGWSSFGIVVGRYGVTLEMGWAFIILALVAFIACWLLLRTRCFEIAIWDDDES